MKRFFGVLIGTAFVVTAAGCGGPATIEDEGDGTPTPETTEREYPPGVEPSDNTSTRSAQIYLQRANEATANDTRSSLFEQALEQAIAATESEPRNPKGYYQAGQAYIGLDNFVAADSMFDRAQELYPAYEPLIDRFRERAWVSAYNAGVTALQEGNEEEAITSLERATQIFQKRPEARINLAAIYTNRGDTEEGIAQYRRALEIFRNLDDALISEERLADYREQEGVTTFNLAQLLAANDQADEAIELYRSYIEENPDDRTAKINLATTLAAQGRTDEAAPLFEEVLGADADLTAAQYFEAGVGLFNAGQYERAIQAFTQSVDMNPNSRDAVFNLAQALLARSNELESELEGASGPRADELEQELIAVNEQLVATGQTLRDLDPYSQNVLAITAGAYRVLADHASGARADELRRELSGILQTYETLPFTVDQVRIAGSAGQVTLSGSLTNLTLDQGEQVALDFSLLDASGSELASQTVNVTAPAQEQSTTFNTTFNVDGSISGWSYERAP